MSAKESSSAPMGELTFNNLASNPSKKSANRDTIIKIGISSKRPMNRLTIAKQPQSKFSNVKLLGMCFLISKYQLFKLGRNLPTLA